MSFLRKLFGAETAEDLLRDAERKLAENDLGGARITFERARAREQDEGKRAAIDVRIGACLDALASARLVEAKRLIQLGEHDLAIPEVEGALEIARDADVRRDAEAMLDMLSRPEPEPIHAPAPEPSRADRVAMIVGRWSKDEDAELDPLGEPLLDALVALDELQVEQSLTALEAIVAGMATPRHVMRPLARARRAAGKLDEAVVAIEAYLTIPDLPEESQLSAYAELASVHAERRDVEAAIAAYERCVAALDDDPRPLLLLGQYLRLEGRPAEALEVLELAAGMMESERDFQVVLEMAHCRAALAHEEPAIALFEEVLAHFRTRGRLEMPEDAAVPLADLYEKRGRLDRAADLMCVLAEHGPRRRRSLYGIAAARLVNELGLVDEARRLLRRAKAAAEDPELRGEAERRLAALG